MATTQERKLLRKTPVATLESDRLLRIGEAYGSTGLLRTLVEHTDTAGSAPKRTQQARPYTGRAATEAFTPAVRVIHEATNGFATSSAIPTNERDR